LLTGLWLARTETHEYSSESKPATIAAQSNPTSSQQFYLMRDSLKAGEYFRAREGLLFESHNSLGVPEEIAEDFAELLPDFMFIGDENAAREQFLVDQAYIFQNPQHYFKTVIRECVQTNG
jgi:hypothetical protein